jgi:hypothetical protein
VVDHVEEFPDGDSRWPRQVRPLVMSGVRDDQALARSEKRVEEQLAVFAADVAVADSRILEREVVTVTLDMPGKAAVVQSEKTDNLVRDGAHRDESAHREVAGSEIGAGGLTLEPLVQDRSHVVTTEDDRTEAIRRRGLVDEVFEQ